MKGIIRNKLTGELIPVHSTTEHPDSHWNRPVWVDDNNTALLEVGLSVPNPFYTLVEITEMTAEEQRQAHRTRIGQRIAQLRKEQGYSTRQLAELAEITQSNLSNIENGRYSVGFDILQRIAAALGCSIELVPLSE